jgi:hypothetical protein
MCEITSIWIQCNCYKKTDEYTAGCTNKSVCLRLTRWYVTNKFTLKPELMCAPINILFSVNLY